MNFNLVRDHEKREPPSDELLVADKKLLDSMLLKYFKISFYDSKRPIIDLETNSLRRTIISSEQVGFYDTTIHDSKGVENYEITEKVVYQISKGWLNSAGYRDLERVDVFVNIFYLTVKMIDNMDYYINNSFRVYEPIMSEEDFEYVQNITNEEFDEKFYKNKKPLEYPDLPFLIASDCIALVALYRLLIERFERISKMMMYNALKEIYTEEYLFYKQYEFESIFILSQTNLARFYGYNTTFNNLEESDKQIYLLLSENGVIIHLGNNLRASNDLPTEYLKKKSNKKVKKTDDASKIPIQIKINPSVFGAKRPKFPGKPRRNNNPNFLTNQSSSLSFAQAASIHNQQVPSSPFGHIPTTTPINSSIASQTIFGRTAPQSSDAAQAWIDLVDDSNSNQTEIESKRLRTQNEEDQELEERINRLMSESLEKNRKIFKPKDWGTFLEKSSN